MTMNMISTAILIDHHDGVGLRRLADAADQQQRAHDDEDHRGQVDDAALFGRVGHRLGDLDAEHVADELVEVLRPAHRDGRARHAPFEQQAGADAHGHELAERRVGVGVRRPGDRHGAGQFGVTDCGQAGDDSGDHERPDDRGPCHWHGLAEDEEDAGADRAADADRRETPQSDRAFELAGPGVGAGFGGHLLHRLAPQYLFTKCWHELLLGSFPIMTQQRRSQRGMEKLALAQIALLAGCCSSRAKRSVEIRYCEVVGHPADLGLAGSHSSRRDCSSAPIDVTERRTSLAATRNNA